MYKILFNLLRNFLSILGLFVIVAVFLILFYGESAKQRRGIIFNTIESFVGLGVKYDGFIANTPKKLFHFAYLTLSNKFVEHDFNSLNLEINLENLKLLEKARLQKLEGKDETKVWAKAKIKIFNSKNDLNQVVKVKLRPKGDRELHYLNLDSMSYKIDVRGKKKFILNMEEMSLQKPILRNYSWEILYQKLLKTENILSLDIIPVKFYRNGRYLGVFVLEEGFSKELLEKQERKEGPIIGINENLTHFFPLLTYEYYSENYWKKEFPDIYRQSNNKLEIIKTNFKNQDFYIFNYFDLDLWARYFAISDFLKMFHGTVTKSVKLYYNPTTNLFEPIAFDGHYQSGYNNFSFIDFVNNPKVKCGYACGVSHDWYGLFFNHNNSKFLEKYIEYLKIYTSEIFLNNFYEIFSDQISEINNFFYSDYQHSDRVFYGGVLPYYFDFSPIRKRSINLRKKILNYQNDNSNLIEINDRKILINYEAKNLIFNKNEKIKLSKGIWKAKNLNLIDTDIVLEEGSILILEGVSSLKGINKELLITGPGMLVQINGKISLDNVKFNGLKNIKLDGLNWSGAINLIHTKVIIGKINIENTISEDSINIVNSNTVIDKINIINAQNDAIDIDFGDIQFNNIYCSISGNDCLDTSGANVNGNILTGENVTDKLGSFGESSNIKIDIVNGEKINVGVAAKDGSDVKINQINLKKINIPMAIYQKKFFYGTSLIEVDRISFDKPNNSNYLVSYKDRLTINNKEFKKKTSNQEILKQIY